MILRDLEVTQIVVEQGKGPGLLTGSHFLIVVVAIFQSKSLSWYLQRPSAERVNEQCLAPQSTELF